MSGQRPLIALDKLSSHSQTFPLAFGLAARRISQRKVVVMVEVFPHAHEVPNAHNFATVAAKQHLSAFLYVKFHGESKYFITFRHTRRYFYQKELF